jgi:hypothetical protein
MLNVSSFGNTADVYAIVHLVPHACQQYHGRPEPILLSPSGKSWQLCARAFHLKKNFNSLSLSLSRCKNYHDPLSSPFVEDFLNVSRTYEEPCIKNIPFLKHSYLFGFLYIILRKPLIMYVKVANLIKLNHLYKQIDT